MKAKKINLNNLIECIICFIGIIVFTYIIAALIIAIGEYI